MDDIGFSAALDTALYIYGCMIIFFSAVGSFGLYKMLRARRWPAPIALGLIAFFFAVGFGIFAIIPCATVFGLAGFGVVLLLMFTYALFGLFAWVFCRTLSR